MQRWLFLAIVLVLTVMGFSFMPFFVPMVFAHCDTMRGPVILAAKKALATGNVDLVLIWVQKKDEAEIRKLFKETLSARKTDPKADMRFFEALVRIHRAGEGASFTGIKDEPIAPIMEMADKALDKGSVNALSEKIAHLIKEGIETRFKKAWEAKKHMNESVEAGRRYVKAYVEYVHYVEAVHGLAEGAGGHHHED